MRRALRVLMKVEIVSMAPKYPTNYSYILFDEATKEAAVVDPAAPGNVIPRLKELGVTNWSVLTTHYHQDHAGGNPEIRQSHPDVTIYGGPDEVAGKTNTVNGGDQFNVGNLKVNVLYTPCHTKGHVLYYVEDPAQPDGDPVIFTGDTIFTAGCGRFFEGTAQQMCDAFEAVSRLPPNTQMYSGHEYTVKNLEFAVAVEPNNKDATAKLEWARQRQAQGLPTVPSTLAEERTYNPFFRSSESSLQKETGTNDTVACMAELRRRKDNF